MTTDDLDRRAPARRMTVLAPKSGAALAKKIERDGALRITPAADHALFDAWEVNVADHDALGAAVTMLAQMPNAAVVRGAPTAGARSEMAAGRPIRRLLRDRDGAKATIEDTAKSWLCIDADGLPADLHDLQHSPFGVVEEAVASCLPALFQNRTVFWRFSSSSGFKPGLCSLHLWFWLSQPRTGAQVRQWFEDQRALDAIDPAPFIANQLIFTANAVLGDAVVDPLPQRSGWLIGDEDKVALPEPLPRQFRPRPERRPGEGLGGGACAGLDRLGDGENGAGFHAPLRASAMRYARDVQEYGRPRDDEGQIVLWQSCVEVAECRDDRRRRYRDPHYLGELIRTAFEKLAR